MSSRIGSCRVWFASVVLVGFFAGPAAAQPPSPLELVRGLRENGEIELALEYLKEIEGKPLSPDDKAAITLERAKCLLDASEDEPDEGTRLGMVAEAKELLNTFLVNHAKHPRVVEALLATAKLRSLDAKTQLSKARRMDIPPDGDTPDEKKARELALTKQKEEAKKAQPMFLEASKRFAEASDLLRAKLEDKTLNVNVRRGLEREAFEAELASGINQFNIAETFMRPTVEERKLRDKFLEAARDIFIKSAKGPTNNRTTWVARAWSAEVTYEQDKFNDAAAEVAAILRAGVLESEDGKRLARFFQLRRNFLLAISEKNLTGIRASETEMRRWLGQFGNPRKPTAEMYAVRYYLGFSLQVQAEASIGPPPKDLSKPPVISQTARTQLTEAERIYRTLAQTDHDYTSRATRNRMSVVRKLLGEADQPPSTYDTFERAQMASLIQMSKLAAAEAMPDDTPELAKKKEDEIQNRRLRAVALLERSRELATAQDNPADVTDVHLRLIYFYHLTDQPHQAAVLGEFVARTIKTTGGKASLAGLLAVTGYMAATTAAKIEDPDARDAARKADRERAILLARFLDEKYPNDTATDAARHRLASLLFDDGKLMESFKVLTKVRPGYADIVKVRLLEGYVAGQLIGSKSTLTAAEQLDVYRRAVADLVKVPRPVAISNEDEVRGYIAARCRLATLLFSQGRVDPAGEKANPGYNQALAIANETLAAIPTFDSLMEGAGAAKKLNLDGMEMNLLAQDARTRAIYLRGRALTEEGKFDEAAKTLEPTLDSARKSGPLYTAEMKSWAEAGGDDPVAIQKSKVGQLAVVVDKTRVDVILAAFRLQVKQGKPADAEALLDLMIKAGGTVEDNLPVLEVMGRELAVQMLQRRKEAKEAEAKNLGAGLAVLLKKIATVKNLPQSSVLFVGQTLQMVGENDKAIETLKKVPVPEFAGWDTKKPEDFPQEVRGKLQNQIRDYATAQLFIARALRGAKKFAEAEAMLKGIIGTAEKQGWGYGRLYFRKELAELHEDKGAAQTDIKAANTEWGLALREWTTLFQIHRNRLSKLTPEDIKDRPDQVKSYRNTFADAYFDVQRCLVEANQQLLKGQPPAKLQKTYDDVAQRFVDMEKQIPAADWQPEVQHRYVELLEKFAPLKNAYKAAGGKAFLEKMPLP